LGSQGSSPLNGELGGFIPIDENIKNLMKINGIKSDWKLSLGDAGIVSAIGSDLNYVEIKKPRSLKIWVSIENYP
jgi:hypothetical protein